MNAVLYFAVFMIVIAVIFTIITQISYRQRQITRSDVRYRLLSIVFICILTILFAFIATYFHISILFVYLGFALLIVILGAIAYVVLRARQ